MVFQPGPNEVVDLRFGILLALIGAAVIAYGGWRSMQEEGTSFEAARDQLRDVRRHAFRRTGCRPGRALRGRVRR